MAAELAEQTRVTGGHRIQRIAQMQTGDRATRALQGARLLGRCKGNYRAVNGFLYPRGKNPHHSFMPFVPIETQPRRQIVCIQPVHLFHGRIAHALLNGTALPVNGIQLLGHLHGFGIALRKQAGDAMGHIRKPARGVQTRPCGKAHIRGQHPARITAGHLQQCTNPRAALARPNPPQPLLHQHPVGIIQHHHIGHRPQRHQVQQIGYWLHRLEALLAKHPLQIHQQIKRHPHTGQIGRGEILAARQARVHQRVGIREGVAG